MYVLEAAFSLDANTNGICFSNVLHTVYVSRIKNLCRWSVTNHWQRLHLSQNGYVRKVCVKKLNNVLKDVRMRFELRMFYYHDNVIQCCYIDDGDAIAMILAITLICCLPSNHTQ